MSRIQGELRENIDEITDRINEVRTPFLTSVPQLPQRFPVDKFPGARLAVLPIITPNDLFTRPPPATAFFFLTCIFE